MFWFLQDIGTVLILCYLMEAKVKYAELFYLDCGVPSVYTGRVIGGSTAKHGAFPWQVGLQEHGRTVCGGSIISPYWVLTASHCIVDARSNRLKSPRTMRVKYVNLISLRQIGQAWVLAPDIGKCPAKNRVMSDETLFTTDTVAWREVIKIVYKLPTS